MKTINIIISFCIIPFISLCQTETKSTDFNLGFENTVLKKALPDNWFVWGSGYTLSIDTVVKHSGKNSVRIEPKGEVSEKLFGCVAFAIPAKYKAKKIKVQAWMKLQNISDGPIGLLLRIDGESDILQFDNMQQMNIQGTKDWELYTVELPYPDKAKKIYIGAINSGKGQLWVDDFQLFLDGKKIEEAKKKKAETYKAESDKEFDAGSEIAYITLSKSTIENLAVLGKVWGFLKYYHPVIASGDYNWDYELFRIMPEIIKAKDVNERNEILSAWVSKLGTIKKGKANKIKDTIKLKPDLVWISDSVLGEKLSSQLIAIRDAKRNKTNYYVGLTPYVGNPEFKNESAYKSMKYPDAGFRLLCLYRYWNIIQYFSPNKDLIGENWNDILTEFIPEFVNDSNELDYKLTTLSLIARIHDTHANIWGNDAAINAWHGTNYAPVEISFIEDKAVVTDYYNDTLGEKSGLKIGDVIETINNKTVDEIIKEALPYTPASNYPTQLRDIAANLLRTNDTIIKISFKRESITKDIELKCFSNDVINIYKKYMTNDTCFKLLFPDIAYLYPGSIQSTYLPEIMPLVTKTKGLIIDLRCYPSDFIVFTLSKYLQPEAKAFVKFSNGSITNPGIFTLTPELKVGSKNEDYYKGKVVIIINELTQSQAEYTTMALRTAPGATVIGSTTAGADGNVSPFTLPGGIKTMISGIGVYYPDGTETQRVGIIPDIVVKPTIKGITEGKDELLEKAIEIINTK
jgi:C-terminal processing protease CtpA/Prc